MTSSALAAMPLARNAVTFSFCHCSRSARTAMPILVSKRTVINPSFLDGPADGAQVLAEGQRGRVLPPGQVTVELQLAAERDAGADLAGLMAFGVPDGLGDREQVTGPGSRDEQHAVLVAEDQVLGADRVLADRGALQRVRWPGVEALRAGRV